MALETKLLIACFAALAAALVFAVTRVLGAWSEHHIVRHDLIVESKRQRLAYYNAIAERQRAVDAENEDLYEDGSASVIIEDNEPASLAA